ncbi:MAG: hypothetical protein EBY29_17090, partial [Planctomycetes bacterium]|nr:hypothetical protein [Planctomycetota bacterium]
KIISNWKDVDGTYGFIPSEIETYVWKALNQQLPSKANIMPLYVKAENPFDYQNPDHVKAVLGELNAQRDSYGLPAGRSFGGIKTGNWELIEKPIVQQARLR